MAGAAPPNEWSDKVNPPEYLFDCYVVGDNADFIDWACEEHAREFAADNGLTWNNANTADYTEDAKSGLFAYAEWVGDSETDYPRACDWPVPRPGRGLDYCGRHLHTALTPDGEQYVRDNYPPEWWHLWGVQALTDTKTNGVIENV